MILTAELLEMITSTLQDEIADQGSYAANAACYLPTALAAKPGQEAGELQDVIDFYCLIDD